jgi:ribosomal protein S18 acetylase RimI-like enzyme
MRAITKNHKEVILQKWTTDDLAAILVYLNQLSSETRKRFAPHSFDLQTLKILFQKQEEYWGYIAKNTADNQIVAYSIGRKGLLPKDAVRLQQCGVVVYQESCFTIAPSVADDWQSEGVGSLLMDFILSEVKNTATQQITLWGGVQADNLRAIRFYHKYGFETVGKFERSGPNYDMILSL